jgi:hypothetical protein
MITNAYFRLLFNLEDGLEVNGRIVRVLVAPQAGGEWVIAEWAGLSPVVTVRSRGRKGVY